MAKKKAAKGVRKSILELIDIQGYDKKNNCYCMKDGSYMNIIQIMSKDLVNSSDDEVEYDCLRFARLYKLYAEDIKIITMNFPCDTAEQQHYIEHKMQKQANPVYKNFLQRKLDELVWLGKHDTTREYYYMIFAKNTEEMEKNTLLLMNTLGRGKTGLLAYLTEEKRRQILFRLANKCSMMN